MVAIETSLMAGATIGLSIAAPFGPTSMLCIQRTLGEGLLTGLATGLGVATVHLTYGMVASLSGSHFEAIWRESILVPLLSSFILMLFAVRVLRSVVVLKGASDRPRNLAFAFCGAVGFAFLNPLTPFLFAAASPNLVAHEPTSIPYVVAGVFLGSLMWWSILTGGVSYFRSRVTARVINASNKVAGGLLVVMAMTVIVRGYYQFF